MERSQLKIGFEEIPYIHGFLNVGQIIFYSLYYDDAFKIKFV